MNRINAVQRRLVGLLTFLSAISAAMAYWITHEQHQVILTQRISVRRTENLKEDRMFYCPVCGEMVQLNPASLSIIPPHSYLAHAQGLIQDNNSQWQNNEKNAGPWIVGE